MLQFLKPDGPAHHALHIQTAGIDQLQRPVLCMRIDKRRPQSQLLLEDLERLHRDLRIRLRQTEHHNGSLVACQINGLLHGGRQPRTLDHGADPCHPGFLKPRLHILVQRINTHIRAQFPAHLTLFLHRLQQSHPGRSGQLRQLQHQHTDHAAADDHYLMSGLNITHVNTVQTAGHRFRHRSLCKSRIVAQTVYLTGIHHTVFRKTTVFRRAVACHMLTEMHLAVPAEITGPAIAVGVDTYPVSGPKLFHITARRSDNTRKLMPEDRRRMHFRRSLITLVDMHIRAADPTRLHLNLHFPRPRCRHLPLLHPQIMLPVKNRALHPLCPSLYPSSLV